MVEAYGYHLPWLTIQDDVEAGRMLIAPDCGLMTIARELARAKARLLVEVAQQLRREIGVEE